MALELDRNEIEKADLIIAINKIAGGETIYYGRSLLEPASPHFEDFRKICFLIDSSPQNALRLRRRSDAASISLRLASGASRVWGQG